MGQTYLVKGVYRSLIPDGSRTGQPSVFVSFAGCNLWSGKVEDRAKSEGACGKWCHADFAGGQPLTTAELLLALREANQNGEKSVWLTGGEPMLQVDSDLMDALREDEWTVAIETNGTIENEAIYKAHWVQLSPKLGSNLKSYRADEVKFVLPGALPPDPGWTESVLEEVGRAIVKENGGSILYVTPQDPIDPATLNDSFLVNLAGRKDMAGIFKLHLERCVSFVARHRGWALTMPLNKMAGIL